MSGDLFAYSRLVEESWARREDFLIVEHDIEMTAEALYQAVECPCEWSVSPYKGPSSVGWELASMLRLSLGFTRFRASLMEAMPDAMAQANAINDAGTVVPPGDWHRLDCRVYTVLRGSGEDIRSAHLHAEVPHHHVFGYGCACGGDHGQAET